MPVNAEASGVPAAAKKNGVLPVGRTPQWGKRPAGGGRPVRQSVRKRTPTVKVRPIRSYSVRFEKFGPEIRLEG